MKKIILLCLLIGFSSLHAQECELGNAVEYLDINNVKATLLNGGDFFRNLSTGTGGYEVPKDSGKHTMFSGALWIGGTDDSGNVYECAETYRSGGVKSYFPGPIINTINLTTDEQSCNDWNRHFKVSASQIEKFNIDFNSGSVQSVDDIPDAILFWPGPNNPYLNLPGNETSYAPFVDVNSDNIYDPLVGDRPKISGDQSVWWIMNDVGGTKKLGHVGPTWPKMGLEISVDAFGYASNDVLNNATFQTYKITNRSSKTYYNSYCGFQFDCDLGNTNDDFVRCDVGRGMGFVYNGLETDSGPKGYGEHPPSFGIDFVKGIKADDDDGIDNNRNCVTDEADEDISMSNFMVYQSSPGFKDGHPTASQDYYKYLRSIWRDSTNITYDGALGYDGLYPKANFAYPGSSDSIYGWNFGGDCDTAYTDSANFHWSRESAGHTPNDERFVMSMGPFTLNPGETKEFTVAFIYARSTSNRSIDALKEADDFIQLAADNNFAAYRLSTSKNKPSYNWAKVYPSVVDDEQLTITVQNPYGLECDFQILNQLGQTVFSTQVKSSAQVDVSDLSRGSYFYKITNRDSRQTGKLTKL